MEWNAVLEEQLKQARRKANWRWVGYIGVLLGFVFAAAMFGEYIDERDRCESTAGPDEVCTGPPIAGVLAPGGVFLVLGLLVALPAEKAAKQAKLLRVQKQAANGPQTPPSA